MFVLDCSVTMPWILKNDPSGYAVGILKQLATEEAIVPRLWVTEVMNVLLVRERQKGLSSKESIQFLQWLKELPIEIDPENDENTERIYTLAREHVLSAYDGVYLELAVRKNVPIATLDKILRKAAKALGISLM